VSYVTRPKIGIPHGDIKDTSRPVRAQAPSGQLRWAGPRVPIGQLSAKFRVNSVDCAWFVSNRDRRPLSLFVKVCSEDVEMASELMTKLENWASETTKISPVNFECTYFSKCDASIGGKLSPPGSGCCMSYLGQRFPEEPSAFKLAIVGLDHRDDVSNTYEQQRTAIENHYISPHGKKAKFNHDYHGIARVAACVFGRSATVCARECVRTNSCAKARGGDVECVLERIIRPNLVKCVGHFPNGNADFKGSWEMATHCSNYLLHEIMVAKPTLVVFFGNRCLVVKATIIERGLSLEAVERDNTGYELKNRHGHLLFHLPELACHMLFLYHPSRSWLDKTWDRDVGPAIQYLRTQGVIPG
jgi:hypothetical protein